MRIAITGTSSGIGHALAQRVIDRGHEVWGVARSDQSAFEERHRGKFRFSRADVASWEQMQVVARDLAAAWTSIDAVVCCAGTQGTVGPALTLDPEAWAATVRANLEGTFFSVRSLYPLLRPTGRRGKIVCFSGGGSSKPRPRFSAYGVAKTGIVRLVETLAEELRGQPVDINAIAPGAIHTRMTDEVVSMGPGLAGPEEYQAAEKNIAAADSAPMEKALALVEWMLSPESDGVSGRLISAPWDPWPSLDRHKDDLASTDIYTLRRVSPEDRDRKWRSP